MQKPIVDFYVLKANDPKFILIADNSMWQHIEGKTAIVEITFPGSTKAITHYYSQNQINSFNSVNLKYNCNLDCGCEDTGFYGLPDGVYTITVKGSPSTFFKTKYYLKTDTLRLKLAKVYFDLHLEAGPIDHSKKLFVDEIDFLIEAAEANIRLSNLKEAQELYRKASFMMDTYLEA